MKYCIVFLSLFLLAWPTLGQKQLNQYFYVGTYTEAGGEGIYLCHLDTKNGAIRLDKTFPGMDNPSFLKLSSDRQFLYAVSETARGDGKTGNVNAYKVTKDKGLTFLNSEISVGDNPCHVDVSSDGKYVVVSNYHSGTFSLLGVQPDGSLSHAIKTIYNSGSGPNKARQQEPHAHSAKFSPYSNAVFNADLGTDQLNIFYLEGGTLVSKGQSFVQLNPGAGPRHFEFHPSREVIYVINELSSTVSVLQKEGAVWSISQSVSTLPAGYTGESYCADIHISKDGRFLYGSNRGHNSIAVFAVDADDASLKLLSTVPVEGNWPRNFGISPNGEWMLVANKKSNNISVFSIDKNSGSITFTGKELELPAPVCIEFF